MLRSLLLLLVLAVLLAGAGSAWYVQRGMAQELQARAGAQQAEEVELVARLLAARVEQQQKRCWRWPMPFRSSACRTAKACPGRCTGNCRWPTGSIR
ncbi:hypothetical protein ACFQOZ_13060 [Comamonas endophytica]|uniref:hypothetical protein n=1 Tax=Comamonas endophytica TaxID=2949090 RepID=UPI00361F68CD